MRAFIKKVSNFLIVPLVRRYVKRKRSSTYQNIRVVVQPGVFHPGLFHSTRFLLKYLARQHVKGATLLELGCGTGLIAIAMAQRGAMVTGSDINHAAVANAQLNAQAHQVAVSFFVSDLFQNIPAQEFDWIVINPPYYRRDPLSPEEYAWNAGKDFQYFKKLFTSVGNYIHAHSQVLMVITLNTDLEAIFSIASENGFALERVAERKSLFDKKDFLFKIRQIR